MLVNIRKLIAYKQLHDAEINLKIKKGQLKYVFDFLKRPENLDKFVKQGDVLLYCDNRRNIDSAGMKPNFKDNSRQVEKLRKDLLPSCWVEDVQKGELYFKFDPNIRKNEMQDIINSHKKDSFPSSLIEKKICDAKYKCEITGLSGKLAADHFIPKESGGKSTEENCVILNKLLNEKKNKRNPIEWFCFSLLKNFLTICKRCNVLDECKKKLILYISNFE